MNIALRDRQNLKIIFVCSVLTLGCLAFTCNPPPPQNTPVFYKFNQAKAEFNLGDTARFDFQIINIFSDGNNRILIHYQKTERAGDRSPGTFYSISEDGGASFNAEQPVAALTKNETEFSTVTFLFIKDGLAAIGHRAGNIFYTRQSNQDPDWTNPVQINDEQNSARKGGNFLQPTDKDIYCVWVDRRRGFSLVYFSASHDGGKTWSPNQPVEYDFREGMQDSTRIVPGANGRLLVFWTDWRDRKTLVDIRYSYSDDRGRHWTPSKKINDDESEVWQIDFSAAARGSDIFVAFSDFREEGEENDKDWNVYFSRSADNGTTWEKNTRLNDIKEGRNVSPRMAVDHQGNLYCFWWTTQETLFGQLAFSYSTDKGISWSPSVTLTGQDEMIQEHSSAIISIANEKLVARWTSETNQNSQTVYRFLEKSSVPLVAKNQQIPPEENIMPMKFEIGKTLFADDFSDPATVENWHPAEGFWTLVDETYMGVHPNIEKAFVSFAEFDEPEQYVLRGRFKLDPVAHTSAAIYFRADKTNKEHYVINNRFRYGTWLSIKDGEAVNEFHISGGTPLTQKSFPLQNNRWYEFILAVTPERVDYYVDGRLMLSHAEKLILPSGKIGIGGNYSSPTYFDDISVAELKR